jgi:hypothetical protein
MYVPGQRHIHAVRREGDRVHPAGMDLQGLAQLARAGIPELDFCGAADVTVGYVSSMLTTEIIKVLYNPLSSQLSTSM